MYARAYDCQDSTGYTINTPTDTAHHWKRDDSGKAEKPTYIGKIADDEKKYKKIKKNLEIWKNRRIFVAVIKIRQHYESNDNQANQAGRIFQASTD